MSLAVADDLALWASRQDWRRVSTVVVCGYDGPSWDVVRRYSPSAGVIVLERHLGAAHALARLVSEGHVGGVSVVSDEGGLAAVVADTWHARWSAAVFAPEREADAINRAIGDGASARLSDESTARVSARDWTMVGLKTLPRIVGLPVMTLGMEDALLGVPAIILGGGPSLDIAADMLRRARGRAAIISTNTAVGPLERAGLVADIVCGLEHKELSYEGFVGARAWREAVFAGSNHTHEAAWDAPAAGTFFVPLVAGPPVARVLGEAGVPVVRSGGSVTCMAFQVARYLGCSPIILAGVDCAVSGGAYAAGVDRPWAQDPQVVHEVEAFGGDGLVGTTQQFESYRRWLGEQAYHARQEGLTVINTSALGARIDGTVEVRPRKLSFDGLPEVDVRGRLGVALASAGRIGPEAAIRVLEQDIEESAAYAEDLRGTADMVREVIRRVGVVNAAPFGSGPILSDASIATVEDSFNAPTLSELEHLASAFGSVDEVAAELRAETRRALDRLRALAREAA